MRQLLALVCLVVMSGVVGDPSGGAAPAPVLGETDVRLVDVPVAGPVNLPPVVTLSPPNGVPALKVYADSATGATVTFDAFAADPENDPLTYTWSGPFIGAPVTGPSSLTARIPLGTQHTITVSVDDGQGNVVQASITLDVVGTSFIGATAKPFDSTYNAGVFDYAPVTISAAGIGSGANLAFLQTRQDKLPAIPSNLQAGSPPLYFDVSADALLSGPLDVCIDTAGMSFPTPATIRLYHYRGTGGLFAWEDITQAGQSQAGAICGRTDSLGTFAIFYPQVTVTAVTTIAGSGILEGSLDGPGGDPADDFVAGPATATALHYLFGVAHDPVNRRLYTSDGFGHIVKLDLQTNTLSRVAGNGVQIMGIIDGPGGNTADDLIDGGGAFSTYVGFPAELAVTPAGDVLFFDRNTCLIRRLDVAQSKLVAVAGNGICGYTGDGGPAQQAAIHVVNGEMVFDRQGHLFFADTSSARIRRIDAATGIITTVAGDGTFGIPADGTSALSTISMPLALAFDRDGQLLVVGGLHLLRISTGPDGLVNGGTEETIRVVTGCNTGCNAPFNGDGLPVSDARIYLPFVGHLVVAQDGAVVFSDMNRIRRIDPGADGVVTGTADEIISTIGGYLDLVANRISNFDGDTFATQSLFSHSAFLAEDDQRRIIVVDPNNHRIRRFGIVNGGVAPGGANLSISASAAPDPVGAGEVLAYTLTIANAGPAAATAVTVTYALPAGVNFDSVTSPAATCTAPPAGGTGTVSCVLATLARAASSVVTVTVRPQTAGTLDAVFTVAGDQTDPETANNSATVSTAVLPGPAIVKVIESIRIVDSPGILPAAVIGVAETVSVRDAVAVLPSALIAVNETVGVTDGVSVSAQAAATPTTTTLVVAPNPSQVGQVVLLTATVTGGAPTGVVTFANGGVVLGTGTVSGNQATFSTTSLGAGLHALTASYGGDAAHTPSTSTGRLQLVLRVQSAVTVSSSANPSALRQPVRFTVTVTALNPTGSITLLDGLRVLDTVPLVGGVATFTTDSLTRGTHAIWAIYGGDPLNSVGISGTWSQRVR